MSRMDRFKVGDAAEIEHTITAEDVERFANLTGDDNPVHVDRRYAERTPLKGVVAHGMLSASFISTIVGKHIPGEGALWVSQSLDFLLPVRVGDRITVKAEIIETVPHHHMLGLRTEILNQHGQKVLTGQGRVRVLELEEPEAAGQTHSVRKVAIVTGASRGIGAATARRLARDGFAVVVNFHRDEGGAQQVVDTIAAGGGRAAAVKADVTDPAGAITLVERAVGRFGPVTALVNNASSRIIPKAFSTLSESELEAHLALHLKAPLRLIQAVLPSFAAAGQGAVVNLASIFADSAPPPQLLAYAAAKAALVSATKSLAVEFGPQGFRFNVVAPGMTDTALIADTPEKSRLLTKMQTPLRRLAHPDDIANAVAFLLSEDARHITGETLRVCGGIVML